MKNKILFLALSILFFYGSYAQINEGFEDGIPAEWAQYESGAEGEGFEINTDVAYNGSRSVWHNYSFIIGGGADSWLVTEAQTVEVGLNEYLSFWYRQEDTFSYDFSGVYISTDSENPLDDPDDFELLQEFDEEYGYSEGEWSEYTKDLSDYEGETIYIAFKYAGDIAHVFYIDDVKLIDTPDCENPEVEFETVSDCENGNQFNIEVEVIDMGGEEDVVISDNQGEEQTVSSTGTYTVGPYENGTEVVVSVENEENPNCSMSSPELAEHYCSEMVVECTEDPVETEICYDANEEVEVTYTADDEDSVLNLEINSGFIDEFGGDVKIIDSDGETELYSGVGDNGDISGVTAQSTGDEITISYVAGFYDCNELDFSAIGISVFCADCVNPQAEFTTVADCEEGQQFLVDVEITDMGSADEVIITDDQGEEEETVSSTGTYTVGPYENGTPVEVFIENADDEDCKISEEGLVENHCSEVIVQCEEDPTHSEICYEADEELEITYTADDEDSVLNLVINSGDVYQYGEDFKIIDSNGETELYSGLGDDGDISGITAQSTGDEITISYVASFYSCNELELSAIDLEVSCANCVNPQAEFTTVADCEEGQQFLIDVEITDMGSADEVIITDNQGEEEETVSATGTYTVGPYENGTPVEVFVENADDEDCTISSNELTEKYCSEMTVECSEDPVNSEICYDAYEEVEVVYTADNENSVLNLVVNSGIINDFGSDFIVLDSDGETELYSGTGDNGDLSEISVQSTGDELTVLYTGGYDACGELTYTAIDIDVYCADCVNPQAEYVVENECGEDGEMFTIDVEITDLGTAESVEITDSEGVSSETVDDLEIVEMGPYSYNTEVVISIENTDDENCIINSDPLSQELCAISTDTEGYTTEELVEDVLIDNSCAQITNISSITGVDFNDVNGIGYFDGEGTGIPINEGIIMSTGGADSAPGPYAGMSEGTMDWEGDEDIEDLIEEIEGSPMVSYNASVIEFDFVPFTDHISFDYFFASSEYGTYQCSYSDTFAFFLTDEDGNTINLATVPDTDTPVSVTTIRDEQYHDGDCSDGNPNSYNEEYFDTYYGTPNGLPEENAPINYKGYTVKLTAEADVNPGETYHIKLAIADRSDTSMDSAVFLEAGSFDIGEVDLGDDLTIENGTAPCEDDTVTLDAGIANDNDLLEINWYKDGDEIEGETSSTLEVDEDGEYIIVAIFSGTTCVLSDEIVVEFAPNIEVEDEDYSLCGVDSIIIDGEADGAENFDDIEYIWYFKENEEGDYTEIENEEQATLETDEAGYYKVEVNTDSACSAEGEFVVIDGSFEVDLGEDQELCEGDSYELTAQVSDGIDIDDADFIWEGPNGSIDQNTQTITVTESGDYNVTVVAEEDCDSQANVTIHFNEIPVVDLGGDIFVISLDELDEVIDATPTNTDENEVSYEWTYTDENGDETILDENGPIVNPQDYGYGTYTVTVINENGDCETTESINVQEEEVSCELTLSADNDLKAVVNYCEDDDAEIAEYEITFTADFEVDQDINEDDILYTWYQNDEEIAELEMDATSYTVTYDEAGSYTDEITVVVETPYCSESATLSTDIIVEPYEQPCKLTEGISPGNNDGYNDYFDLTFINDRSGIKSFKVYNRYGREVYSEKEYTNSWHGQNDKGKELTTGTYYYIIEMKNEDPVYGNAYKGWIYVNQNVD